MLFVKLMIISKKNHLISFISNGIGKYSYIKNILHAYDVFY